MGPQNGSRKRSYNDRGDGDAQDRGIPSGGGDPRAFKQPRRGGNMGYSNGRGYSGQPPPFQAMPPQSGYPNMPAMPSPPPGMPPLDPNNPMAAIMAMQAMGFPVPGMPGFPPAGSPGRGSPPPPAVKKLRCRDYDTKGFCARGNACQYEHGNDSIYVPPRKTGDGESNFISNPLLQLGGYICLLD